jgi:amidohydrolase
LDDLAIDAAVGCHVASIAPTGLVGIRAGVTMSDSRKITITASGVGGHGALYTGGADPIVAIALVAARLGTVVEGLELEGSSCACSAGILAGGTAPNVIPNHAHLEGTLRVFTPAQLDAVRSRLDVLLAEVAEESGCSLDILYGSHAPAVVNDAGVAATVRRSATELLGEAGVFAMPPASPSDDVSEFLARIPGAYFFVGAGLADGSSGMHHNSGFAIDEACMPIAASVLASSAVALAGE